MPYPKTFPPLQLITPCSIYDHAAPTSHPLTCTLHREAQVKWVLNCSFLWLYRDHPKAVSHILRTSASVIRRIKYWHMTGNMVQLVMLYWSDAGGTDPNNLVDNKFIMNISVLQRGESVSGLYVHTLGFGLFPVWRSIHAIKWLLQFTFQGRQQCRRTWFVKKVWHTEYFSTNLVLWSLHLSIFITTVSNCKSPGSSSVGKMVVDWGFRQLDCTL